GGAARKVFPLFPGVERLDPAPTRGLGGWTSREAVAVFAGDEAPVLAVTKKGKGDIVTCAVPEIFQNGRRGLVDQLGLLDPGAGPGAESSRVSPGAPRAAREGEGPGRGRLSTGSRIDQRSLSETE